MPKTFTEEDVIAEIQKACDRSSQKDVAEGIGISAPYLSRILAGRDPVTDNIAAAFGYEREVVTQSIFRRKAAA